MATKPLIYNEIEITAVGGGTPESYDLHVVESAEIVPTPAESQVEDGQTLTDYYDVTFAVNLYDASVLNDARVYTDAGAAPVKADIIFKGVTGAATVKLENVIINGTRVFDQQRVAARLFGSKRAVTLDTSVNVS